MKRTEIREQLFKLLFRVEFNDSEDIGNQVKLFFDNPTKSDTEDETVEISISKKDEEYISSKFRAIVEKISEIDEKIGSVAEKWTTERIGKVELTILRVAIYEMLFDDTVPESVAINEAVELAKKYGQDGAGAFVNGVLAKLAK